MPWTPLHYPAAYLMRKAGKKLDVDLDMAALAMGSFMPDLECPFFIAADWLGLLPPDAPYAQCHRLVLHSILGSLTLGCLLTIVSVLVLYRLFAPEGMRPPGLANLYAAAALGNLSHLLLDWLNHPYNPLLFPFTVESVPPLLEGLGMCYPLHQIGLTPRRCGSTVLGNIVVYSSLIPALVAILILERKAGRRIFIKLLFDAL